MPWLSVTRSQSNLTPMGDFDSTLQHHQNTNWVNILSNGVNLFSRVQRLNNRYHGGLKLFKQHMVTQHLTTTLVYVGFSFAIHPYVYYIDHNGCNQCTHYWGNATNYLLLALLHFCEAHQRFLHPPWNPWHLKKSQFPNIKWWQKTSRRTCKLKLD